MPKTAKQIIWLIILIAVLLLALSYLPRKETAPITSFKECAEAGNPVMESYPRQCRTKDGELFVEDIGNLIEKVDLIRLESPLPGGEIESPLVIRGEARGYWFFEASFPIVLTNWDGLIIAESFATAEGEWMTEEFVPFEATLEFISPTEGISTVPDFLKRGFLILEKDNPSGLPEHDDALEIPIFFK
jgi:hypothetical protein